MRPVVAEDLHPWTAGREPVAVRTSSSRSCSTCAGQGQIFTLARVCPASCSCSGERTIARLDRCPTCGEAGSLE